MMDQMMTYHSKLNDASKSYVEMLDLTSYASLAKRLDDMAGPLDKNKITSDAIKRLIKKHCIETITISGVKFLSRYNVDLLLEKQTRKNK